MLSRAGGKYRKSDSRLCATGATGAACATTTTALYVCYYRCCCCFGSNFGLHGMAVVDNIRSLNRTASSPLLRVPSNDDGGSSLEGLG